MKTINVNLYEFNELPKDVKEKIIDEWYEKYENYPFLKEDILEFISDEDEYFSDIDLGYSLSHSQDEGLCFFKANFDLEKFIEDKYKLRKSQKDAIMQILRIYVKHDGRYPYAKMDDIKREIYNEGYKSDLENLCDLAEEIAEHVRDYYIELCKKAKSYGYSIIDYRMDEEEFSDFCDINGYMFLESGVLIADETIS